MPPVSMIVETLLSAVLPAFAVAAIVMVAVHVIGGPKRGEGAVVLGLLGGAGLGLWLNDGLAPIAGDSAWNRLPWAALAAVWLGRVARFPEINPSAGWLLRAATALAIAWLVVPAEARKDADWLAPAFAALVFALWFILEHVAAQASNGSVLICLAVVFFGAAGVIIHAGWASLMNAALVMAAAFAGIGLVAWLRRVDTGSAAAAAAVLLPGYLLMGQQQTISDVPWPAFALPALAPLLLAEALPFSRAKTNRTGRARFVFMLILVLVPLAIALYLAQKASPLGDI